MGKCRFLYDRAVNDVDNVSVSSNANGVYGGAFVQQIGVADMIIEGIFNGKEDKVITIEIDGVGIGKEVGQATFKWKNVDGDSWNAVGVTTSDVAIALADGITVKWVTGVGDDFEVGDRWTFPCLAPFGISSMLNSDRGKKFRTGGIAYETITIDLLSAVNVRALLIFDHNLTSAATITLQANSSDSWVVPLYSQTVTWNVDKLIMYLDETYRYWRIIISDAANPDGHLQIGELFLGNYFEPEISFVPDAQHGRESIVLSSLSDSGTVEKYTQAKKETFDISFRGITKVGSDNFFNMFDVCSDEVTGENLPVFFNDDSDYPTRVWMMFLPDNVIFTINYPNNYSLSMMLEEKVKPNV